MLGVFMAAYLLGVFIGWGSLVSVMALLVCLEDWLAERQELRQEREDFPKARVLR